MAREELSFKKQKPSQPEQTINKGNNKLLLESENF